MSEEKFDSNAVGYRMQSLHHALAGLVNVVHAAASQDPPRGRLAHPEYRRAVQDLAGSKTYRLAAAHLAAFELWIRHHDPKATLAYETIDYGREGAWGDEEPEGGKDAK